MATDWTLVVSPSALRELARLEDRVKDDAVAAIGELREDPIPLDAVRLRGQVGVCRIKVFQNRYRVIYQVSAKQRRVIVTRVRPRSSAYAGL